MNKNNGNEKPVNFQLYLDMVKNDTITWEFFTQIMKDFVNNVIWKN